ncbi:MAG: putative toxin-antitoxin system toxin component, PIN family [Actinomycetota bacterium]
MRAVLDVNVLVAAAISPDGTPALLIREWQRGRFDLIVSDKLLDEFETVIRRNKFRRYFPLETVVAMIEDLRRHGELIDDPPEGPALTADPSDDYLPALAQAASADALVSGDAHLISKHDLEPRVVTPREFLETLA